MNIIHLRYVVFEIIQINKSKLIFRQFIYIVMILFGMALLCCMPKRGEIDRGEKQMPALTIEQVLKKHTDSLMSFNGVIGTGQGLCDEKPCITVYVIETTPELEKKIPKNLDGYPVMIKATGRIKALDKK